MITKEIKEKNFRLFLKKLNALGLPIEELNEKYGEAIQNATFTASNEHGNAYEGSLLEIVLKKLTPYAIKLNDMLPQEIQIEKNTLVKVCLLHHIAKGITIIPNDNEWEMQKRGLLYKYDPKAPALRTGTYSLIIASQCGISFTLEEAEAMTINDKELTDNQARWHSSVFATIIRQANELTYTDINNTTKAES